MFTHPHQQRNPVANPLQSDKELLEFSGRIQGNLFDLWTNSHDHTISLADRTAYAALSTDAERIAFIATFIGLV